MSVYNEHTLPEIPLAEPVFEPESFMPESPSALRVYMGLAAGIAMVAVASGLYSWRDRWQASKDAEEEAEKHRDEPGISNDEWFRRDKTLQDKITDTYAIEDGPRD
jgi:hypothetical protein